MSVYEGGLLDRVVFDSFVRMVRESLDQLGWFDVAASGRTPLTLLTTPVEFHDEIPTNAAIIQFEDHYDDPGEIGSTLTFDRTMADAILDLYRSATRVGIEWGPGIDRIEAPGLLVESLLDPFRSADRVRTLADRTGAKVLALPESGHFWMLDASETAAAAITAFWATV